jgi:RNA polymerase sigma factor (sigma-70 family)
MGYEGLSISELLQVCLTTGSDAWTEFIQRIQRPVAGKIIRTLGRLADPGTVDDLVQETWLRLFRNDCAALRGIRAEHANSIFDYVTTTARRVALDHIASRHADLSLEELVVEPADSQFDEMFKGAEKNQMDRALRTLSDDPNYERDYVIFWRYYEQGYSCREISELPGANLTVKGVEAVIIRLTRLVKKILGLDTSPEDSDD